MANQYDYDVFIIGSGSAGFDSAQTAKEAGAKRVALAESWHKLGGECPNRGCVPTKAMLRSVELLNLARRASEFGLKIEKPSFDWPAMIKRKNLIVDGLTGKGRLEQFLAELKVELYRGRASFLSPHELEIDGKKITADKVIMATGSIFAFPPIHGLKENAIISDDVVEWQKLPKSLIVVGGGPIGAEVAQLLAPLGVEVAIIEFMDHILPREDSEAALIVQESMRRQGVKIFTSSKTTKVEKKKKNLIEVTFENKNGESQMLQAEFVLAATGKKPALDGLNIEKAGVRVDQRGAPVVNEYLQTTASNIYVAGDALGKMLFTHVAHETGGVVAWNAVKGNTKIFDFRVIPRGTFTVPEVGSVGMTEKEARAAGYEVGIGKVPYSYLGKSATSGELEGLVKLVVDKKTKEILGGHITGQIAADIIHEVALAMSARLPYTEIARLVHAFPTYAEAIGAAAANIE